jgi:hypothetical protein
MRRNLAVLSALAVVAGLAAVSWVTSAGAINHPRTFTLVAREVETQNVDVRPLGESLGDRYIFSGVLERRNGDEHGRFDGSCTVTSVPGAAEESRQQCSLTSTIGTLNGETEIQAEGVGRVLAEDVILSVTGGSLRFRNVRGQATVDFSDPSNVTIKYELIP